MEFFTWSHVVLSFLEYVVFHFRDLNIVAVVNVLFSLIKKKYKSNFCSTLTGNVILEKGNLQKKIILK